MMATVAPSAAAFPDASTLSSEERALAAYLQSDVVAAFERTRGAEQRIDVYLALNRVLRLDDTDGSVRVLQHHLPVLLRAIHDDLQHATLKDALHVALRTLSYFMYHKSLARGFSDAHVEAFLSDIMSRLASTQDEAREATYKLCLWCLTMQNFDLARLDFLPRIVEALVLAVVNPFKSRASTSLLDECLSLSSSAADHASLVEVQALKGLHLLLLKCQSLMVARAATLRIWFRPVASRLGSSDKATRDHVALLLLEAASLAAQTAWPSEMDGEVAAALTEYALPAIQTHMTHERNHDALAVWKIVLLAMRRSLASDLPLLNDLLSVPERSMRHADASVRLQSLEAWRHVVDVFRQSSEWVLKKPVLVLLVRPIVVCLEEETATNVLHAAVATWRVLVATVVDDFNAYCKAQSGAPDAIQQSAKKWKRWMDEAVRKVVAVAIEREHKRLEGDSEVTHSAVYEAMETTVRELFGVAVASGAREQLSMNRHSSSTSSSSTTAASSIGSLDQPAADRKKPAMDLSDRDEAMLDDELVEYSASASSSSLGNAVTLAPTPSCPPLAGHLLGLALVLPDVLKIVEKLVQAGAGTHHRYAELGFCVWDGLCTRLKDASAEDREDSAKNKLRLRLVRLCLDFAFGISSSSGTTTGSVDSQASVLMPSLPTESVMTAADLINGSSRQEGADSFHGQLRLLRQVVAIANSKDERQGLFEHPKSKISQSLLSRVDGIVEKHDVYREWLARWDQAAPKRGDEVRIDFSAKTSVGLCVLLYLLMKLAVAVDDADGAGGGAWGELVSIYQGVVDAVLLSIDPQTNTSNTVEKFCRVVAKSAQVVRELLNREVLDEAAQDAAQPGRLFKACAPLVTRSEESQENAAALLQLQRSPAKESSPVLALPAPELQPVSSSATVTNMSDANDNAAVEAAVTIVSSEANYASSSSPCMLQSARSVTKRREEPARPPHAPSSPPSRQEAATDRAPSTPSAPPRTPTRPKKPAARPLSTPSKQTTDASTSDTSVALPKDCIFPALVHCTEPISILHRYFPIGVRHILTYFKVDTVGDLSSMTAEEVKKLGIKDPVATSIRALEEFQVRQSRPRLSAAINSPFRKLLQSPPPAASPGAALASPSPKRILKRPTGSPIRLPVTPLPLESPQQRKRARRSLQELSSTIDEGATGTSDARARSSTEIGEGPKHGEDSQEAAREEKKKEDSEASVEEKMRAHYIKLQQHLRRSLHYADKIGAEEATLQSDASLHTVASRFEFIRDEMETVDGLLGRICASLGQAAGAKTRQLAHLLTAKGAPSPPPDSS